MCAFPPPSHRYLTQISDNENKGITRLTLFEAFKVFTQINLLSYFICVLHVCSISGNKIRPKEIRKVRIISRGTMEAWGVSSLGTGFPVSNRENPDNNPGKR